MTLIQRERTEEVRHVDFRAADTGDGQTLEGYAAVFNVWTDIRDSMGTYKERIAPGAFKRSLGQRTPVLQFDHGTHPLIGSLPLGSLSVLREDRNGLYVKARLSDNWLIQPVRDAITEKAITGMSFRFRVIDDEWGTDGSGETRTLKEVELLELGPVVFPAYEQTSVAVRSLVNTLSAEMRTALSRELRFDDLFASDLSALLRQALIEKFAPTDTQYVWVRDNTDSLVVFDLEGFDAPGTFRLDYTIADGTVTFTGDPVPVIAQTSYVDAPRSADDNDTQSRTSPVAGEPAIHDDGPVKPPVASHDNRKQIADAYARFRTTQKGQ